MARKRLSWARYKQTKLAEWGFLPFEYSDFGERYTMAQLRSLPYLKKMIRWRRLYVSNLKKKGWNDDKITIAILGVYDKRGWLRYSRPDPWQMLKAFRKQAIDNNEYIPRKKGGSHHPKGRGWSAGDRKSQKSRRQDIARRQARDDLLQKITRAIIDNDQAERKRLEDELNRRFGG